MIHYIENTRWKFFIGVIVVPLLIVYLYQTTMNAWQFQQDYQRVFDQCQALPLERAQAACFVALYAHGPDVAQRFNYSAIEKWPECHQRAEACGVYNCTTNDAMSSVLVLGHCLLEAAYTSTCYVKDCALAYPDIKRAQDMCGDVVIKSQSACVDALADKSELWTEDEDL